MDDLLHYLYLVIHVQYAINVKINIISLSIKSFSPHQCQTYAHLIYYCKFILKNICENRIYLNRNRTKKFGLGLNDLETDIENNPTSEP